MTLLLLRRVARALEGDSSMLQNLLGAPRGGGENYRRYVTGGSGIIISLFCISFRYTFIVKYV